MAKAKARAPQPKLAARWLREAQGVVALGLAAYLGVALLSYDPALRWVDQEARVGVVGLWVGWALFTTVGYAAYLVPVMLMVWAFAAFTRPFAVGTLSISVGTVLGLLAVTGLLAQFSGPVRGVWLHRGGWLGWAVAGALRRTLGDVGALVLLLTLMAVAGLCITQASYAGLSRTLIARLSGWARLGRERRSAARAAAPVAAPAARPARPRARASSRARRRRRPPSRCLRSCRCRRPPSGPRSVPAPGARSGRGPRRTGRGRARSGPGRPTAAARSRRSSGSPSPARRSSCRPCRS